MLYSKQFPMIFKNQHLLKYNLVEQQNKYSFKFQLKIVSHALEMDRH